MKPCLFTLLALASSMLGLSCINPFAPKLDFNLQAQLCNDLTNIDNVLCTFRNAYAFKDTTLYGSIIASDFTFLYRDYDKGVDVFWGRDEDIRTTFGLFQSIQRLDLVWNTVISSTMTPDSLDATIIRNFNLTVTFSANDIVRVEGYANWTLKRTVTSDVWKIIRWRDESNF